ncbi:oligopeptide/dipeptide ABC transporter ATP-binding protein [Leadbettera azotonutricia]|uniref:Oligopeptide transport ATP-binding protein AppF n=1 Tax=Leadbettera azotonutricia (strain ATCC BAA-888 / DSM 13862 / ZAS-9) TaxID=545695 RepID=F5YG60_LEAAZ|nr:ABC transporter ATP-binding protein [Leadbettera azotonutricia]AEF81391.1 oligopeptide transport ATP-binding protein AppF [Leadbettera azotonutricia ZAS-9]
MTHPVISVSGLRKRFNLEAGFFAHFGRFVYAVNDVSFSIGKNETYGLVGESGCGKTTTARLLVRMYEADEGAITFIGDDENAVNVRALKGKQLRLYRQRVKYVFQDPARSLNPRMRIFDVLTSGPRWTVGTRDKNALWEEAAAILEEVGLSAADLERRPAEFSGGQRQRISIARGLLMRPDLLICDEVVSALDVSIQGQILNLLLDIRSKRDLSFLFIAHDLKVACYFCDRIGVMYRGELMEEAPAAELYRSGIHPYTELLFSSVAAGKDGPVQGPTVPSPEKPKAVTGEVIPLTKEAQGCAFASRCSRADAMCFNEHPELKEISPSHLCRCFKV